MNNKTQDIAKMKTNKLIKLWIVGCCVSMAMVFSVQEAKAGNVIFSFQQTTSTTNEAMDLFVVGGTNLVTSSMTPNVFFALGFVDSAYSFVGQARTNILTAIGTNYIGSVANTWTNVGSGAATGGKVTLSFDNGGNGFNTASLNWTNRQLVAVVSRGVNPLGGVILDSTELAIVRSSVWSTILPPDASPSPITQTLDVRSFDQILYGNYSANVGIVSGSGSTTRYFDTIALIPEPSSASLLLTAGGLVALQRTRRRKTSEPQIRRTGLLRLFFPLILACAFLLNERSLAQVSTPVVGFMKVNLPAGKASLVSFPLNSNAILSGSFTSKSGNVVSTGAGLSNLPATLLNNSGEPIYYVEITSGAYKGILIDVVGKSSSSLTLSDASPLSGSESFQLRKYTTIADVFGANNSAGLKGADTIANADVVWIVNSGTWKQYFFYDDGAGGDIDPLQWQTIGSSANMADTRIDPDQGVLIVRQAGSDKNVTIVGQVKATPSFVPFINGAQIFTNPYPVDKTLGTIGLKTGNGETGLVEGDSLANSDVVYKLDNGTWKQYFIYNDGAGGDIDPIQWQTIGSGADQSSVPVSAGEALLVIRKGSAFSWQTQAPSM